MIHGSLVFFSIQLEKMGSEKWHKLGAYITRLLYLESYMIALYEKIVSRMIPE